MNTKCTPPPFPLPPSRCQKTESCTLPLCSDDSDILGIEQSLAPSSVSKNAKRESAAAALLGEDDDIAFLAKPPAAVASKPKSSILDDDDDDFLKSVGKKAAAPKAATADFSTHSFDLDAYIKDSKTTTSGGIFD